MFGFKKMAWYQEMTRFFCTYFDSNYLVRGIAMCRSLAEHCPDLKIYVLALDETCFEFLNTNSDHQYVIPLKLGDLEEFDQELCNSKGNRSKVEYIFTITPCLPRYLLQLFPEIDIVTYIDADTYFFSSPEPIYEELGHGCVAITPHHFAPNVQYMANERGKYNVGWISYVNNRDGIKCLEWYRERCLEWCFDRVEEGKFADQKYLDYFKDIVQEVVPIQNRGVNLAAWNLGNGGLEFRNKTLYINGDKLVFFHYQGLKHCFGHFFDCGLFSFRLRPSQILRQSIFCKYIQDVCAIKKEYSLDLPDFSYGSRYESRFPFFSRIMDMAINISKICMGYTVSYKN